MMENIVLTGVSGLDAVLDGGLTQGNTIVLEGTPGSGKTTVGFQFLYYGATLYGEPGIYVTFEELPAQLYVDMANFGWDLRQLEKNGQLRVICLSPETLIEQMTEPDGLFDQIVNEMKCKRIVIDSISMLQYGLSGEEAHRKVMYRLRNVLRKKGLTSLLIREQPEASPTSIPFEHFVADGVIRLTVKPKMERYRERVLEVLKMRGQSFLEGEHVYRISKQGVHLIPALYIPRETVEPSDLSTFYTSVPALDRILGGGIQEGSVYMFDTNSKSDYKHIFGAIITAQLKQGRKGIIVPSTSVDLLEKIYALYGLSLKEYVQSKSVYFIEHYNRPYSPDLSEGIIDVSGLNLEEFQQKIRQEIGPVMGPSLQSGDSWFIYYDLNTIISERGEQFITNYFTKEVATAKARGITLLVLCNFKEVGESVASFLERTSDGVIRTWVDNTYQYLQITKLPGGRVSDIQIVEHIPQEPYVRLV